MEVIYGELDSRQTLNPNAFFSGLATDNHINQSIFESLNRHDDLKEILLRDPNGNYTNCVELTYDNTSSKNGSYMYFLIPVDIGQVQTIKDQVFDVTDTWYNQISLFNGKLYVIYVSNNKLAAQRSATLQFTIFFKNGDIGT